jgi:hypothetical protein
MLYTPHPYFKVGEDVEDAQEVEDELGSRADDLLDILSS